MRNYICPSSLSGPLDIHVASIIWFRGSFFHVLSCDLFFSLYLLIVIISIYVNFQSIFICSGQHHLSCSLLFLTHRCVLSRFFKLLDSICITESVHWILSRCYVWGNISNHNCFTETDKRVLQHHSKFATPKWRMSFSLIKCSNTLF